MEGKKSKRVHFAKEPTLFEFTTSTASEAIGVTTVGGGSCLPIPHPDSGLRCWRFEFTEVRSSYS